jgi:hypothetical protein
MTRREVGDTTGYFIRARDARPRVSTVSHAVCLRRDGVFRIILRKYTKTTRLGRLRAYRFVSRGCRVAPRRVGTESDGFRLFAFGVGFDYLIPPSSSFRGFSANYHCVHIFVRVVHFLTSLRSLNWSTPLVKMAPWAEKSSASPVSPAAPGEVRYSKYVSGRFPVRL